MILHKTANGALELATGAFTFISTRITLIPSGLKKTILIVNWELRKVHYAPFVFKSVILNKKWNEYGG